MCGAELGLFSERFSDCDKVCWCVYETNHRLPGLVPGVSRFSLSLYLCIVLISANEVNLCQDLTNYLLLEVTRARAGAGDIWCIVKHAGTHGLAWPPPPPLTHLARV